MKTEAKKFEPAIKIILIDKNGEQNLVEVFALDVLRAIEFEIDGHYHSIVSRPGRLKSASEP